MNKLYSQTLLEAQWWQLFEWILPTDFLTEKFGIALPSSGLSHFLSCKLQEGDLNCPVTEHTMISTVFYFSLNNLKFANAVHAWQCVWERVMMFSCNLYKNPRTNLKNLSSSYKSEQMAPT